MRKILDKIWGFLVIAGEVLADMPEAEVRAMLAERTCPNCGYKRTLPTGCGPF